MGIALVTGAANGIGKETAHLFAEKGCLGVVYADNDHQGAIAAAAESKEYATNQSYRTLAVHIDVSDSASVQRMVDQTAQEFGRIDYSVNAAGVGNTTLRPAALANLDELHRIVDINIKGTAFCIRAVVHVMLNQELLTSASRNFGRGSVVNLGSAYSYMTLPDTFAYTASKHGVIGLTKAAAFDHAKDGIRVNAVCPGPVDTALLRQAFERAPAMEAVLEGGIPLGGRLAQADEIASVILFLAGPGASYVTGVGVPVDAGVTLGTARL
ncbi:NAD(P)-binding protein [Bimuria novae-zelandiae CBS 107.79]|uniref:NAD(P)-binding protein n=1 Tax=Bimuria novae-zelandiae CBS 107.79 TaxID=1447943 RepID=A0A6A5UP53_9PLEO|nr:NAD(P)-binding protein [Bimuria novae-zelandiae CBS 107.79]